MRVAADFHPQMVKMFVQMKHFIHFYDQSSVKIYS